MANTYTKIFSSTVGSGGASSIDFQSIPQTFDDLVILGSFRSTGAEESNPPMGRMELIINNTTTGNLYTVALLAGIGSGAPAVASGGTVSSGANRNFYSGSASGSTSTSNTFSSVYFYIPSYTSSINKSFSIDSVTENNGTGADTSFTSGLWLSTAAINRLTLRMYSLTNLAEHSKAVLYGVKRA